MPSNLNTLGDHIRFIGQYFRYSHLKPAQQEVSKEFDRIAQRLAAAQPEHPQTFRALELLLEAKDAAVRASLPDPNDEPSNVMAQVSRNEANYSLTDRTRAFAKELTSLCKRHQIGIGYLHMGTILRDMGDDSGRSFGYVDFVDGRYQVTMETKIQLEF